MNPVTEPQILEVIERYRIGKATRRIVAFLKRSEEQQNCVLRDWATAPVYKQDEIETRSALDRVLGLVGALEVLSIGTGGVVPLPDPTRRDLMCILCSRSVRNYYEVHFPIALPTLLRGQLERSSSASVVFDEADGSDLGFDILGSLLSFLELDGRFVRGVALGFFLSMLDEYTINGVNFETLVDMLEDSKEFERRVLRRKGKNPGKRLALVGLEDFLEFCVDLHRLLARLETRPILRGSIWLHYCYWFGNAGKGVQRTAHELQRQLGKWTDKSSLEDGRALTQQVSNMARKLVELTDWREYANPVVKASWPSLKDWAILQS